ncbi:hypothetical protein Bbelb_300060 [Branchiostoma belcheri]|nr:hypothetical protein Bbelb_300060 [Branchiostoma belcheri]
MSTPTDDIQTSTSVTLPLVSESEIIGNCSNIAFTSRYRWYFKPRNAGSTSHAAGTPSKTTATPTSRLAITPDKPESSSSHESTPNLPLPFLIGSVCGPAACMFLIFIIIRIAWYKMRAKRPPLGINPNSVGNTKLVIANAGIQIGAATSTYTALKGGTHRHPYEDINKHHVKTGQGQTRATIETNTNITATDEMTSVHDHRYEDVDQHHQTGQGQAQTITEKNTATVLTSGHDYRYEDMDQHDQTGQGQSQTITEINTNTPVSVTSGQDHQTENEDMDQHDQTGQGQSQATAEALDVGNVSYDTGPTTSQLPSLYENQHDQAGQGQSQATAEASDMGNVSYGTGPAPSQLNSLYENVETS